MPSTKTFSVWFRRASIGVSATLLSHTGSCDSGSLGTINDIIDGVQTVINQLEHDSESSSHQNDISFGDWILDELN